MDFLTIDDGANGLHYPPALPSSTIPDESTVNGANLPDNTTTTAAPSAVSGDGGKRKRGRPRKYPVPDKTASAKRLLSENYPSRKKKGSSAAAANGVASVSDCETGNSFNTYIINVAPGEDVCQKVMMFLQQSNREMCIVSCSGSISGASLSLTGKPGVNMVYQGLYDIISLSGAYIHTESGERSGGLRVCLSGTDGQIIGGGVSGPLIAANKIQVIVGTFVISPKNDNTKTEVAPCVKLPSPSPPPTTCDASLSGSGSKSPAYSPHFQIDENLFLNQHHSIPLSSMQWGGSINSQGMLECPTNADYDFFGN